MKEYNINVLIVDDDTHSLIQSKKKIELYVPSECIYTAINSVEIMQVIKNVSIDLAFLDVEMPDTDGFSVANYIKECQSAAKCVFLTGHVEFGAKSYDYEALDFLCKPMDAMRLQKTFERFMRTRQNQKQKKETIAIEGTEGFVLICPDEVKYITRENRKSVIYCKEICHVAKSSLDELELIFSDFGLFRCHQSYLVSVEKIKQVKRSDFGRAFWAILNTEEKIPISRGKYALLRNELSKQGTHFI